MALGLLSLAGAAAAAEELPAPEVADCEGLLRRLGWTAGEVATPAGACFLRDVAPEGGGWQARVMALHGDLDALPDALPSRLTGGVWGLALGPRAEATASFDLAAGGGTLRVDRLTLRLGDGWRGDVTARLEALPEVWPASGGALRDARIAALDGALWSEGGRATAWAALARPWVEALAEGAGPAAAPAAAALRDALPGAQGRAEFALGAETGLRLLDILPRLEGGLAPEELAALAAEASLALDWTPDAP